MTVRSLFSISLTGGWQVVRYEIRFGDSEALLLTADRLIRVKKQNQPKSSRQVSVIQE
jgi:hypothetical protein